MKIIATETPKTLEQYQLALDAAWVGGMAYGRGEAQQEPVGVKFNEGLWQEREARITQLEAELLWMQGHELKLQFALAAASQALAEQPAPVEQVPGMAVQALAGEIVEALLADAQDEGYDLSAGMFGRNFSTLVRRWAQAEWASQQPAPVQGWKLVPVEPTSEMLLAGRDAHYEAENKIDSPEAWEAGGFANRSVRVRHTFAAMLAAAPQPAQRKPLTDDEIWDAYVRSPVCVSDSSLSHLYAFARAIEAAHNIKD